jgi:hypothetical protein
MIPNKNDPKYKEYKASPGVHKLIEDLYAYCDNLKEGEKGSEIKALEYTEARMIELRKLRVKYHEAGMQIITKDGENQLLMDENQELKGSLMYANADGHAKETIIKSMDKLPGQIKQLKELLQYVANEHLCGTPLLEGMKKQGIEYNKPDKKALKK